MAHRLEQRGDVDEAADQGEVVRGAAEAVAGRGLGAFAQQPLDDAAEAVQRREVQDGEAAVLDVGQGHAFAEKAVERGQQHVFVDAGARLRARAALG